MTVNGVGSYGTFAVSGSSGRNVKSGQSVRFNFQAAGEKADNLLAGMKELDTGKRSSDRSILEDSGCFDSSYWSENMKKAAETADSTSCTYPADQPDKEDIRYITWYTEEGIFCRKAGQTEGYEWSISFENREQYEKVMSLIGQLPSDWNLRFEAHENFWRDFLDDKIDVDDFMDFMRSINQGEKIFCRYPGGTLYTADEIDSLMFEQYLKENHMTLEDYHASQEAFRAKHGYPGYY